MKALTVYQRSAKIKRIKTLIYACRLTANRSEILALWGASSFDSMSDDQLQACGQFMEQAHRTKTTEPTDAVRRLRSQVMTLINKIGKYAVPNDWTEVNRFLLQKKISGRLLYMLEEHELIALVRKLRAINDKKTSAQPVVPNHTKDASETDGLHIIMNLHNSEVVN